MPNPPTANRDPSAETMALNARLLFCAILLGITHTLTQFVPLKRYTHALPYRPFLVTDSVIETIVPSALMDVDVIGPTSFEMATALPTNAHTPVVSFCL